MPSRDDNSNPLVFSKADRIAIIAVVSIVAFVVAFCYLYPLAQSHKTLDNSSSVDSLLMVQDSYVVTMNTKSLADTAPALSPFKFNPNEMTEQQWQQLGLTERQIKTINNYVSKGGNFKSKADFAKLYCISDEEYEILKPYIQLPDSYVVRQKYKNKIYEQKTDFKHIDYDKPKRENTKDIVVDLNTADSAQLMMLPKMNKYLASRIVRYRNNLGYYVVAGQLLDVKGVDTSLFQSLVPHLAVGKVDVVKINVNKLDFKSLLRHPYLNYEQVKCIVNYREKRGFIDSWEQLCVVLSDKGEPNPLLKEYVEF